MTPAELHTFRFSHTLQKGTGTLKLEELGLNFIKTTI